LRPRATKATSVNTPSEGIVDDPRLDTPHDRPSVATVTAQIAPAGVPHGAAETLCPARVAAVGHVASPRRVERSTRARLALRRMSDIHSGEPRLLQDENSILRAHARVPGPMHQPPRSWIPVLPPPDVATHPMRCAPGDPAGPIPPPDALSPG